MTLMGTTPLLVATLSEGLGATDESPKAGHILVALPYCSYSTPHPKASSEYWR